MHRLALVIAFVLGTIGYAFAQAPAGDPHHPTQGDVQSGQATQSEPKSGQGSGSATDGPQPQGTMQGMMHMMQGMQGMMGMMHQRAQSEQRQPARMQTVQDCPMMLRTNAASAEMPQTSETASDETTMRAMMQMMQGMMQIMQSQMQSQGQRRPQ
jgi:hypothetical protein